MLFKYCFILTSVALISILLSSASYLQARMQVPHVLAQNQTVEQQREEALQLNKLGVEQLNKGLFQAALAKFNSALVIAKKINDKALEGKTLNNIGAAYEGEGKYSQALNSYNLSLSIRKVINDRSGLGATLNNLGLLYDRLGRYAEALDAYNQALSIAKQLGNKQREAATLNNIATIYKRLGEYDESLKLYQQVLAIQQEIPNKVEQGTTLNNIGSIYDIKANYSLALKFYQQALTIHTEADDKSSIATTMINMGSAYRSQENYNKALDFFQKALVILKEIGYSSQEAVALNNIGFLYANLKQYNKALDFYQQAFDIRQKIGEKASQAATLNNIGFVYNQLGNYPEAEKNLFAAIDIWDSLRRQGLSDRQKISIFETQAATYRFLQTALVSQNKAEQALEIAERGRARAFVDLLAEQLSKNLPDKSGIQPPNIAEIKKIAKEQKATLVQYSIVQPNSQTKGAKKSDLSIYIWVVKPTEEVAFQQKDLNALNIPLQEIVATSRGGIFDVKKPEGFPKNKTEQLKLLYQILIEPIVRYLPQNSSDRVIFIPQNELFIVPFPALQDEQGKYLIEKHTILTAPAIQVLGLTQRQTRQAANTSLLVVGNPIMPRLPRSQLPPLPYAEEEAREIAKMLQTKALIGKDATKSSVKKLMPNARIIHMATHGLLENYGGDYGGIPGAIALAPDSSPSTPGEINGLLTADEIFNMKLKAELVVLSACDTGKGRITGDGVIGLSRSLIAAGADSVVVSLWAVSDQSTKLLMTEFYRQIHANNDKSQALRQAMLVTMKKYPEPWHWAAFTFIGNSETIPQL